MEVNPLASNPPAPARFNSAGARLPPRRDLSTKSRTQRMQKAGASRDSTTKRSLPDLLGSMSDKNAKMKAGMSPNIGTKPLVPAIERRTIGEDEKLGRLRKGSDAEKWDLTPDGGSASREGRQFTVANVGHNGKIYLRPTIRPANQRYPQPNFVFPLTPPSTAGFDALASPKQEKQKEKEEASEILSGQWATTPLNTPSSPFTIKKKKSFLTLGKPTGRPKHRRAMSDSTVQDISIAHESEAGGFKVVITKPKDEVKAKTTEDIGLDGAPLLDINIPSWKIGNPRFTLRGTALIRGSSYAPTEDPRSSNVSFFQKSQRGASDINSLHPEAMSSRKPSPISLSHVPFLSPQLYSPTSPRFLGPAPTVYASTFVVIEPSMFDALTFKPGCDDKLIVRYASGNGAVTAATPPRLVAEITSPSFLDYELISDFFLTFRAFLGTADLVQMLIARLRWAIARSDEVGMIVRVRTFVAIRHWILNYFVDDFMVDYQLRVLFCNQLNDFVDELSQQSLAQKAQIKVLAELKKCWRRICAQYWDGPDFDSGLGPEVPIAPGGIAGHRDPTLDPSVWENEDSVLPRLQDFDFNHEEPRVDSSFAQVIDRAGHIDSILHGDERPASARQRNEAIESFRRHAASPTSIGSMDVISCSFPTKSLRTPADPAKRPLGAHPVDPTSIYNNPDPIASTPRALSGKRVRAQQPNHKRNNSLTDSMRDYATTNNKVLSKNAEILLTLPYAGSLVRGNLLPPGQAFVDVMPTAGSLTSRNTAYFEPQHQLEGIHANKGASAMSGPGMKKLLGSVRRALSHRGQGPNGVGPLGPRGVTTNRIPGTAVVPQARPLRPNGFRPAVRIDILGAEIAEDFKKAVREDATANASEKSATGSAHKVTGTDIEYSAAHLDSSFDLHAALDNRPLSDTAITQGSKSIVIVDGTAPPDVPAMTGALPLMPALNASVEAFADSFLPGGGADPTPPTTPPSLYTTDIPRRSSYILSQHVVEPSLEANPLPPFIPDLATLKTRTPSEYTSTQPSLGHPSMISIQQTPNRPPLSALRHRGHLRQRSSRSFRSQHSLSHRRWASINSAFPRSTLRSFDATTVSEESRVSEIMPQPLRVLRRRPGGDLRGAQNIADLDAFPLHRSRSAGSLTTYSESLRSSYLRSPVRDSEGYVDVFGSDYSQHRADVFSLGAMAEKPKHPLSLFSTHSSKPVLRPSFEAEAQKLAQIPDDIDDDGGIESALAKLEGRKLSIEPQDVPAPQFAEIGPEPLEESPIEHNTPEKVRHRHQHVVNDEAPQSPSLTAPESLATLEVPRNAEVMSFLSEGSRESYNSIPLLERGLTDDGRSKTPNQQWTDQSVFDDEDEQTPGAGGAAKSYFGPSAYEIVTKTESLEKIPPGETVPRDISSPAEVLSFLDVESDNESDLSSELSLQIIHAEQPNHHAIDQNLTEIDSQVLFDLSTDDVPPPPQGRPPSPPMTLAQALKMSPPESMREPQLQDHQIWSQKPLPPTPEVTPTLAMHQQKMGHANDLADSRGALHKSWGPEDELSQKFSVHLPFILAFDSDILAQQFTLIEKDALNEVDWKELIDMQWKNSHSNSRSWVDFLRNSDARGVEVVVARFNIMVKWAISEIVLTKDDTERARCIVKYLHIAAHCRRYRNFATMSQITIALTSNEIARLTRTWSLIPPQDMRILNDLESLVSPTKNFYNLRIEMEGGATETEVGCIPFVGIYTHDLLFNAQRPSEIASSPTTPPLVNFERCRIAASVVKTLLRLLEASTYYQFQPIEGITERCLWMSALDDDDIRRHSESIEPQLTQ
ncbi:hypothetical protein PFICI_09165 [Pestalotiopsis fici W106-1]|uniref:Guanine nucleotide exchange factor LTE1 n=1 Tax=Pestalotiopsis fici (strain W106-1 / CGMCC3.15140) TaxID=1229662 RepID=W3X1R9_PESFW|nr:uncharacterized protein PFICI_09165 [Pestalotiopsis fici W106-1]ETS79312.1 hypothetical protein PFICI_09165 [Pestalotiopsis fici W106-1]